MPHARKFDFRSIADAAELGRGLGTLMVKQFVARLCENASVTVVQTDTPDGRALLMHCARPTPIRP